MGRKLFISDVHGAYDALASLVVTPLVNLREDTLIIGGDMIDRGPDSLKVMKLVKDFTDYFPDNVIVLKGNHEDMMVQYAYGDPRWLSFGGREILRDMQEKGEDVVAWMEWMEALPHIHADSEYVYVHAGIDPSVSLTNQDPNDVIWMPYTQKGLCMDDYSEKDILDCTDGRPVIYGHQPKFKIKEYAHKMCCDTGMSILPNGRLSLVDLTNGVIHSVDEKGLNGKRDTLRRKQKA